MEATDERTRPKTDQGVRTESWTGIGRKMCTPRSSMREHSPYMIGRAAPSPKLITQLGYPASRQTLHNWITRRKRLPGGRSAFQEVNTPEHSRHPPLGLKSDALRCFELCEDVQSVSDEIGYSTAGLYPWRRKYIQEGRVGLMPPSKDRKHGPLSEGTPATKRRRS